jgi:hypothetical protein
MASLDDADTLARPSGAGWMTRGKSGWKFNRCLLPSGINGALL